MSIPKEELHRLIDRIPEQSVARAKRYLERLVKSVQPESPAMPRPHNKPFYIDPTCPKCSTVLVLADLLDDPNAPWDIVWHDEFICPACRDYIYLDWPESERTALSGGQEEGVSWDEFKRELDI